MKTTAKTKFKETEIGTIPKEWSVVNIPKIAKNFDSKRKPLSSAQREKIKGQYPYYGAAGIIDWVNDYIFEGKYLLIAEDGTVTDDVGYPTLQLTDGKFWVSNHAHVLQCENFTETKFLYYILKNQNIKGFVTGAVQPKLNQENLNSIFFPYPNKKEERESIYEILSSLDDKIELNRKINENLEKIASALFKHWFVDFEFPDKNSKPYKSSGGKMIDSELGPIPDGWRVGKLIEEGISTFVKPSIDNFEGLKDYIETANVDLSDFTGILEKITYNKRPSRANMQPVANSFWFARMAKSKKYLLFQERDEENIKTKILSTGFAGIRCIKDYLYFYWCFILSDSFNEYKNQFANGAVQIAISNDGIQKILLTLPSQKITKEFTNLIEYCFQNISNNNLQIQTLSAIRDSFLPKLMSGKIRV